MLAVNRSVVIVEPDQLAQRKLLRLLSAEPGIDSVRCCCGYRDGAHTVSRHPPDLLLVGADAPLLSAALPGGADAALPPGVVLTTTYAPELAPLEAPLNLLFKPFDATRFRAALARIAGQEAVPVLPTVHWLLRLARVATPCAAAPLNGYGMPEWLLADRLRLDPC